MESMEFFEELRSIRSRAEELSDAVIEIRRDLHQHPELSGKEFRTAVRIEEELDKLGISHRRVGETGVLGILQGTMGKPQRVVALRADIDALPITENIQVAWRSENAGVMHACGHDVHTACLLGAARILTERKDSFAGEVRLFFQQAEEIGAGGRLFAKDAVLGGAERVFGIHTAPDLEVGQIGVKPGINNASVDHFVIRVEGKSSHVCTPHKGVDALYIASQIVVSLQAVVTRMNSPVEPVVIGVGKFQAGTSYNAVASQALLEGTTRNISPENRKKINELVEKTAEGIAGIYGGKVTIEWEDFCSPLINDPKVCREAVDIIGQMYGKNAVYQNRELFLSGDDFADLLGKVPGVYVYLGTADPHDPLTQNPYHSDCFFVDERAIPIGTAVYAAYAYWWLREVMT